MPEACNFIKEETLAKVFSIELCEIFKNIFLTEHLYTMLLYYFSSETKKNETINYSPVFLKGNFQLKKISNKFLKAWWLFLLRNLQKFSSVINS